MYLRKAFTLAELALAFGRVNRATLHEDGTRPETDTDHTVMLGLVGCELAPPDLDRLKIAAYALVHDLVEVHAGDTQTLGASAAVLEDKAAREERARERLKAQLGGTASWVWRTLEEYEAQKVPEARYVRLMDKVLPKLTHVANGCAAAKRLMTFDAFVKAHEAQLASLRAQYPEFPAVLTLLEEAMLYSEKCWGEDDA